MIEREDKVSSPGAQRSVLVEAAREFLDDRALNLGAGLAFYGLATLVPIGVLILGTLGLVLGQEEVGDQVLDRIDGLLRPAVVDALEGIIDQIETGASLTNVTAFGVVALVATSSILLVAWKDSLDAIWGPRHEPGVRTTVISRLLAIVAVGVLAALLIAMFVAEAIIGMLAGLFSDDIIVDTALRVGSSLAPLAASTLLLALLYRFGTERRASWPAVWRGTALTIGLLLAANWAYGLYLDLNGTSLVNLASSAIVLILLVYITAQVLLYGAEFIKVWQRRHEP